MFTILVLYAADLNSIEQPLLKSILKVHSDVYIFINTYIIVFIIVYNCYHNQRVHSITLHSF